MDMRGKQVCLICLLFFFPFPVGSVIEANALQRVTPGEGNPGRCAFASESPLRTLRAPFARNASKVSSATRSMAVRFEPVPLPDREDGYRVRLGEMAVTVAPGAMRFDLRSGEGIGLGFSGSRSNVRPEASEVLPGKIHVMRGRDPSHWRTDVPLFARVTYRDLWPGIDLTFYGRDGRLEHDFIVAPGSDPSAIGLEVRGAGSPVIDAHGDLVLSAGRESIRLTRPRAYQVIDGRSVEVSARFALRGEREVGFEMGSYDRALPLVVDPVLVFSSVFGGFLIDEVFGVAFDADGNLFAAGRTESPDFQATEGAYATSIGFCGANYCTTDAFVMKFDPEGNLLWATYLGGSGYEGAFGLALDTEGNPIVAGTTDSLDFPTTAGAYHETCVGLSPFDTCQGAFATKLTKSGASLVWSTYVGGLYNSDTSGAAWDEGGPIAVDSTGHVYLAGNTQSHFFPTSEGVFQESFGGASDAWVVKLASDGSSALWATYVGGTGTDYAAALAVDPTGAVYVGGWTDSPSLPGASGFQPTRPGGVDDGWLLKLVPSGASAVYASYLGGSNIDSVLGLDVDAQGHLVATGQTKSEDFPMVNAAQGPNDWTSTTGDGFATRIAPDGSAILYSTYLGGHFFDNGWDVDIDAQGTAFVSGTTNSNDFPITPDAFQPNLGPNDDAFLAVLDTQGGLVYATFFGGATNDEGFAVAKGSGNLVALGGMTTSADFWLKNSIKAQTEPFDGYAAVLDVPEPSLPLAQFVALATLAALVIWRRGRRQDDRCRFPFVVRKLSSRMSS